MIYNKKVKKSCNVTPKINIKADVNLFFLAVVLFIDLLISLLFSRMLTAINSYLFIYLLGVYCVYIYC